MSTAPGAGPLTPAEGVRRALRVGAPTSCGILVAHAVAGTSRIDPIYSPAPRRRRGRAAAAATRRGTAAGARVDAANPTTTALYARLGVRPVLEFASLDPVAAADAPR